MDFYSKYNGNPSKGIKQGTWSDTIYILKDHGLSNSDDLVKKQIVPCQQNIPITFLVPHQPKVKPKSSS